MSQLSVPSGELLSRLERLAQARHIDKDTPLSEAIHDFLEREEARVLHEQINAAYTYPEGDCEAEAEETALAKSRLRLRRALPAD